MAKEVIVLRYGHRLIRDERVTSHCCLVARAFGAKKIIIAGQRDKEVEKSIKNVNEKWGGKFRMQYTKSWIKTLQELKKKGFIIIHLTMYGKPLDSLKRVLEKSKIAFVIGSKKVEREMFEKCDYNASVTTQPHSEIAALAIALDRVFGWKQAAHAFPNAKLQIIPDKRKKIVKKLQ